MKGLLLHSGDNVAVVTAQTERGEEVGVNGRRIVAADGIPALHKIALCDIPAGEKVYKYGYPIGVSLGIRCGEHVHVQNLRSALQERDEYRYAPAPSALPAYPDRTFAAYRRADGRVGIRNQILIVPTVGCVNGVCEEIARVAREKSGYTEIYAMPHPYGCSQLHDDLRATREILAGLASNPNNGGVAKYTCSALIASGI